jgi:hypothetical protein
MEWLSLIPLVLKLIGYVEDMFGSAEGNGTVKKSTVMGATQVIVDGMSKVSTGGQKETWETLGPVVGKTIDAAVGIANAAGWNKITDDATVDQVTVAAVDNFEAMKNGQ